MTKNETTLSEKKCAPVATLEEDTTTPYDTAATSTARFLPNASARAIAKKAPAPSPDENEQLSSHSWLMTNAGVKCFEPPNSSTSLGLARPKSSLSIPFTT